MNKVKELERAVERLSLIRSHDALVLLKNSISMQKLLYLMHTPDRSNNPLLSTFDSVLRSGLTRLLNVDLIDAQWLQASLSVRYGWCADAGTFAFLASAASTHNLYSILPGNLSN